MKKREHYTVGTAADADAMNLAATIDEKIAFASGQLAAFELIVENPSPSIERFRSLHSLRVAAKLDPSAAYSLGKFLAERYHLTGRKLTLQASLAMYEMAVANGLDRLRNPTEPFKKAPAKERGLRDMISRSLTNIGAEIANSGYPDRATSYFQQSIQIFPANANSHVCLGRMGIFHSSITGIDPLEGVRSWERATKLRDYCHESDDGCPCRVSFVTTFNQVESDYGADHARAWVDRAAKAMGRNKRMAQFGPVARSALDLKRLSQVQLPRDLSSTKNLLAIDTVGGFFAELATVPVEVKVTLAATLLMSFVVIKSPNWVMNTSPVLQAKEALGNLHPLEPFLGDDEWKDIGPPETLYLVSPTVEGELVSMVELFHDSEFDVILNSSLRSLAFAVLFHLDPGFRGGVTSMVEQTVSHGETESYYIPGVVIGNPATVAN